MAALMKSDLQNRSVMVDREKLMATLRLNRQTHIQTFNDALAGYKQVATQKLNEGYEKARTRLAERYAEVGKKLESFTPETAANFSDNLRLVDAFDVELKVPRNYAAMYDAALSMFEWDTRAEVELTYAEFTCLILDQWDWSSAFAEISASYIGAARK